MSYRYVLVPRKRWVSPVTPPGAGFTFFGVSFVPTHGGSNATTQITITPPGSMVEGDLVVVVQTSKTATDLPYSLGVTGGQSWNDLGTDSTGTNRHTNVWWCVFNGTWSADPRFDVAAVAQAHSAHMVVFRPPTDYDVSLDVEGVKEGGAAPGGPPFDVTLTGITNGGAINVTLAHILTVDDLSWTLQTGGWTDLGPLNNLAGTDLSVGLAYRLASSAGATGNVVFQQTAADVWHGKLVSWKAEEAGAVVTSVAAWIG